jgi:4-amino-4-deoxy-L-arabinose transferase-like glycosyltransferase
MTPATRAVLILMAATLVARITFGFSLGLGIDESYTVATGRHPQLSTFDHPPAAWWLAWAAGRLFATESPLALRLPFIALFALTTWLMYRLTAFLFGEMSGFWAAATLNLAPVIAWTSGTWILPDGPLNAALMAGAYAAALAVFGARPMASLWWLAAGACGGLALLSKFHGVFLFAGVGLFLLTSADHRRWLRTPWPYAGAIVAAAIFLPVIVWNAQHGWVSFAFQGGRARLQGIDLLGPLSALGGQALYLLPWLWLPLVVCLGKGSSKVLLTTAAG